MFAIEIRKFESITKSKRIRRPISQKITKVSQRLTNQLSKTTCNETTNSKTIPGNLAVADSTFTKCTKQNRKCCRI